MITLFLLICLIFFGIYKYSKIEIFSTQEKIDFRYFIIDLMKNREITFEELEKLVVKKYEIKQIDGEMMGELIAIQNIVTVYRMLNEDHNDGK